jgi:hypothetical protein
MVLKKRAKQVSPVKNVNDMELCITPDQIGQGWDYIIPENIQLSDEREYHYREVKAYALLNRETHKMAQMLVVLFEYNNVDNAKGAFQEIGEGLESEIPKVPGLGEESVLYELDMKPIVKMKIAAVRSGTWLIIFTAWLFQDYEVEDEMIKDLLQKQLVRIGK